MCDPLLEGYIVKRYQHIAEHREQVPVARLC